MECSWQRNIVVMVQIRSYKHYFTHYSSETQFPVQYKQYKHIIHVFIAIFPQYTCTLAAMTNLLTGELSLSGITAVFLEGMELLSLGWLEVLSSVAGSDFECEYATFLFGATSLVSAGVADRLEVTLNDRLLCGDLIWCVTSGDCGLSVAIFFCRCSVSIFWMWIGNLFCVFGLFPGPIPLSSLTPLKLSFDLLNFTTGSLSLNHSVSSLFASPSEMQSRCGKLAVLDKGLLPDLVISPGASSLDLRLWMDCDMGKVLLLLYDRGEDAWNEIPLFDEFCLLKRSPWGDCADWISSVSAAKSSTASMDRVACLLDLRRGRARTGLCSGLMLSFSSSTLECKWLKWWVTDSSKLVPSSTILSPLSAPPFKALLPFSLCALLLGAKVPLLSDRWLVSLPPSEWFPNELLLSPLCSPSSSKMVSMAEEGGRREVGDLEFLPEGVAVPFWSLGLELPGSTCCCCRLLLVEEKLSFCCCSEVTDLVSDSIWLAAASFNTVGALCFDDPPCPWPCRLPGSDVRLQLGLNRDVGELAALLLVETGEEGGGLTLEASREKSFPLIIGELTGLEKEPNPIRLPRLLCWGGAASV